MHQGFFNFTSIDTDGSSVPLYKNGNVEVATTSILDVHYDRNHWDKGSTMEIMTRSKENVRENGEVFTPFPIVDKMLDLIPDECWADPTYCFLEPTCGNGQFLVKMFEKRVAAGVSIEAAFNTMIGMDISVRNILDSHFRLYERACAQMQVDGLKPQGPSWFEAAHRLVAIATNNIFQVKDSLEVLRTGGLDSRRFVFDDPTGNDQILTPTQLDNRQARIAAQFAKYINRPAGDITGTSLTPFFRIG